MPRNVAKPLSEFDHARQRRALRDLTGRESVALTYVKRDGQTSASAGKVQGFSGKPGFDTGSVTITDPVKGNRTVNLHRIITIEDKS